MLTSAWETQADAACLAVRGEGSEPGSPPPLPAARYRCGRAGNTPAALGPPAPSSRLAAALQAGPCCAVAGHTLDPFVRASQGFGLAPVLCGSIFFFLNTRIVLQSRLFNAISVRQGLNYPLAPPQNPAGLAFHQQRGKRNLCRSEDLREESWEHRPLPDTERFAFWKYYLSVT